MTNLSKSVFALLALAFTTPALAHEVVDAGGGFINGFIHPLVGFDHIVAMVAVGLWGAFLRQPAIWLLPVVFPLMMAFGGALGVIGIDIPAVEAGIALSGLVLGLMVVFAARLPLWAATALVAVFAIFHGHAHGTELPAATSPLTYSAGFVLSTGMLHLAGVGFGLLADHPKGQIAVRVCGAVIAATGLTYFVGAL
ncbi:HupE/UreJ family protein [Paraferrimonas sedimenticola]|uniref:Urease accessory protein UreJ n=1 Tax=Paraferrimonas sedimenticola TaxID=375674 RepID=A0AA37RW10_9GAMM|nr:HupE/UreJ family protein [Paraferrimonas sedimenticola]GLP96048.1 urease accessory protein UreJ [Paraferrimonas sedimenticola]